MHTYIHQHEAQVLKEAGVFNEEDEVRLMREKHIAYVLKGLRYLGPGFICLDASRPWLCYWMLHSLDLLRGVEPGPGEDGELLRHVVATLASCQNAQEGGFGGGPQQLSHCAPTYAAVLSLMVVGTEAAYEAIDRRVLYRWFMARKHPSGGFCMHDDGEVDVRGTYTVISVASLLNLLTPELVVGVGDYLLSCQTYEGGFGGEPRQEAHGGYAFCAFAALVILGRANEADLPALESWLVNRQMPLEGGFQGRTNKLVDGCYSFWQGATGLLIELAKEGREAEAVGWTGAVGAAQLVHGEASSASSSSSSSSFTKKDTTKDHPSSPKDIEIVADDAAEIAYSAVAVQPSEAELGDLSINQHALQQYILHCAQVLEGGLRDKPGKQRDFYHTCYNLSGLSCAQWGTASEGGAALVYGDVGNLLVSAGEK